MSPITLIRADGTRKPLFADDLDTMQEAVGGYVEAVELSGGALLLVNEEGRLMNLPLNRTASKLAMMQIVGDAVLMEKPSSGWR